MRIVRIQLVRIKKDFNALFTEAGVAGFDLGIKMRCTRKALPS